MVYKRKFRKYIKSRYGRVSKRRRFTRKARGSKYRMYKRNRKNFVAKHKLGSLWAPKIAGFGNTKTTILRGFQSGQITVPNTAWAPFTVDYQNRAVLHPNWPWDPWNEWELSPTEDKMRLGNPLDGLGIMKDNYNVGVTKNVYWKCKITNEQDNGVLRVFAIVTDKFTYINKIASSDQLIGGATNGKMYEIGPGKSRTIKIKYSPMMWAKLRRENPTSMAITMGPNSVTDRTNFKAPDYEPWIQLWMAAGTNTVNINKTFTYEMWQWSKIYFYNRRANYVIEDSLADPDPEAQEYNPYQEYVDYSPRKRPDQTTETKIIVDVPV